MDRLLVFILLLPLLMGLGVQNDDEEEGGMGGTGHRVERPIDLPENPEVPEILDEIPIEIDIINMEAGPADGTDGIDIEQPEIAD